MPAPPVRIPSKPPSIQQAPTGGTPMGTPPSARGIAAQLPFVDGSPEGRPSKFICSSLSLLHASTAFLVASEQGELQLMTMVTRQDLVLSRKSIAACTTEFLDKSTVLLCMDILQTNSARPRVARTAEVASVA